MEFKSVFTDTDGNVVVMTSSINEDANIKFLISRFAGAIEFVMTLQEAEVMKHLLEGAIELS